MFHINILLHYQHGLLFVFHSHISFLNYSGNLIFLISEVKNVVLFLWLYGTVLKEKILLLISSAKLFLTLNISYASVFRLYWCIITDLSFFKSFKKVELKLLCTNLSACNPLIWLLVLYCGLTKLMGSIQSETENWHSLKDFFEL